MIKLLKIVSVCFIVTVCFITAPLSMAQAQVTLTVGDGAGFAGSSENPVEVVLNNPGEKVKAVTLEVCDVGDYLFCTGCETTERSSDFSCTVTEQEGGCVNVALFVIGDALIEEGNGPIFSLNFDVSPSAPSGECREVSTENEDIANENNLPLDVSSAPGDFCFAGCGSDEDCDDGLYCTGVETCTDDVCQPGTDPCPSGTTCNEETNNCDSTSTTTTTMPSTTTTTGPSTTTTINGNGCQNTEVRVECTDDGLCPEDDCTTCTAVTECDGEVIDGTYEWELNDEVIEATGDSADVCPGDLDEGLNTLTAFDTTNDVDGSKSLLLGGSDCTSDCEIDVVQETVLRSRWLPSVALITVNGSDTLWQVGDYTLEYTPTESRDLFVLPGTFPLLDEGSQTIRQLIILLPAWFTGCCFDGSVETMIVTVCNDITGCCDIDEVGITMMPLFLNQ